MELALDLIASLALTLVIELPILFAFGMRGRELLLGLLANVLTNPPVVLVHSLLSFYTAVPAWASLAVLETIAFLTEGAVYRLGTGLRRPFLVSLAANAASFAAGLIISFLIKEVF